MNINDVTGLEIEDGVAVVSVNAPPVNALSNQVRAGLSDACTAALGDDRVSAIVIVCEGKTFFAGADITEIGKAPVHPTLGELVEALEQATKPLVAAIHGTAFGGGLELALAAHYRVAAPSAKCGLPEVKLGLLPGAGGTQRLPRLVGVAKALEMVATGEPIGAAEAHAAGLIDALAPEGGLRAFAVQFAQGVVREARPLRKVRDIDEKLKEPGAEEAIAHFRAANARRFRGFTAPEYNIRCIEAALRLPFEEGLAEERRMFIELRDGPQSGAQRYAFFAERKVSKVPGLAPDTPTRAIAKVGVIGAGTMGAGIAMNFLNAGIPVAMVETTREALDRGVAVMRKNYEASAKKGKLTGAELEARMARLSPSLELSDLADCDLVIEAVFEQMEIKKDVFARLDAIAKRGAILASNTSYLSISEIAGATSRPHDVVGLHFFSPANVMRLMEIVRGAQTAPDVIATALKLAKTIGKVGVVVGDCHGFVGNRMLAQRQREADRLMLEGAPPWDIDRVICEFGFPMGPYQMRDLAGNDIGWNASASSSATVREILNEMGRFGQKAGAGYYDYDENRKASPSPLVEQLIADFAARTGVARRAISDDEIRGRCLYAMVNEGVKILGEGVAARASDIDVVWLTGYGWPAYRGGPMYWAEHDVGLGVLLERLGALHERFGDPFAPAPLLAELVANGARLDAIETA